MLCSAGLEKHLRKWEKIDLDVIAFEPQARDAGKQRQRDEYLFASFEYR